MVGYTATQFLCTSCRSKQKKTLTLWFPREICDQMIIAPCWEAVTAVCCLSHTVPIGALTSPLISALGALGCALYLSQMPMLALLKQIHDFLFPRPYEYSSPPLRMSIALAPKNLLQCLLKCYCYFLLINAFVLWLIRQHFTQISF